jgi:hypothetical protein
MDKVKNSKKMHLTVTLDAEDALIFRVVMAAHPHIKRNSDVLRKGIYTLYKQMKIADREELEAQIRADDVLS